MSKRPLHRSPLSNQPNNHTAARPAKVSMLGVQGSTVLSANSRPPNLHSPVTPALSRENEVSTSDLAATTKPGGTSNVSLLSPVTGAALTPETRDYHGTHLTARTTVSHLPGNVVSLQVPNQPHDRKHSNSDQAFKIRETSSQQPVKCNPEHGNIDKVEREKQGLAETKRDLEKRRGELEIDKLDLKDDIAGLKNDIAGLKDDIAKLNFQLVHYLESLEKASPKSSEMWQELVVQNKKQIGEKEKQIGKLQDQIGENKKQIGEKEKQIGKLQDQIGKLRDIFLINPAPGPNRFMSERDWLNSVGLDSLPSWACNENGKWDTVIWEKSKNATDYINEMLDKDRNGEWIDSPIRPGEEELKTGLQKLPLNGKFYGTVEDQSLYVPIHMRGVYLQAIEKLESISGSITIVAIVGPPGIGKSFGLRYALLQLAKQRQVVVFENAHLIKGYLFVPCPVDNNRYIAYERSHFDPAVCAALEHRSNWYLYDPSKTESGLGLLHVGAKTIIPPCPNPWHYKERLKHNGLKLILEPCSPIEMVAYWRLGMGARFLGCYNEHDVNAYTKTEDTIQERCDAVGPLVRYVLCSEDVYALRHELVMSKVEDLGKRDVSFFKGKLAIESPSLSEPNPPSVVLHTKCKSLPNVVDGKFIGPFAGDYYLPSPTGWLHSFGIYRQLYMTHYKHVTRRINDAKGFMAVGAGAEFEDSMHLMLTRPILKEGEEKHITVAMHVESSSGTSKFELEIPAGLDRVLPKCETMKGAVEMLVSGKAIKDLNCMFHETGNGYFNNDGKVGVLYPRTKTCAVWDMAVASNVLINVTRNYTHSVSATWIEKIIDGLDEDKSTKDAIVHLLWLVPSTCDKKINAKLKWSTGKTESSKTYTKCLFERRVKQYMAKIEIKE